MSILCPVFFSPVIFARKFNDLCDAIFVVGGDASTGEILIYISFKNFTPTFRRFAIKQICIKNDTLTVVLFLPDNHID